MFLAAIYALCTGLWHCFKNDGYEKLHCFQMSVKIYFATRIMLQDFAAKILLTFLMNCDQCIYQAWACF